MSILKKNLHYLSQNRGSFALHTQNCHVNHVFASFNLNMSSFFLFSIDIEKGPCHPVKLGQTLLTVCTDTY